MNFLFLKFRKQTFKAINLNLGFISETNPGAITESDRNNYRDKLVSTIETAINIRRE